MPSVGGESRLGPEKELAHVLYDQHWTQKNGLCPAMTVAIWQILSAGLDTKSPRDLV